MAVALTPHGLSHAAWKTLGREDAAPIRYGFSLPAPLVTQAFAIDVELLNRCRESALAIALLDRGPGFTTSGLASMMIRAETAGSFLVDREIATARQLAAATAGQPTTAAARAMVRAASNLQSHLKASTRALTIGGIALAYKQPRRMASGRLVGARYRDRQTWRGGTDLWPRGADYVPPPPAHIAELMDDLVAFAARDDVDPMAQAAIAHAQVRSIEPFPDANDRVARAIIHGIWRRRGVATNLVVPLSAALAANTLQYESAWKAFREGDAEPLVDVVAKAAIRAANAAERLVHSVGSLPQRWREAATPRKGSAAYALTDLLTAHPVVDAARVQELTGASQASAYDAIARLADAGVLTRVSPTRRDTAWAAMDVFEASHSLVDELSGGAMSRSRGERPSTSRRPNARRASA